MKTKLFYLFLALLIGSGTMFAEFDRESKIKQGGFYYYVDYDNLLLELTSPPSSKYSGDVVIPSSIGSYHVTSIGSGAFSGCSGLTSVTIPNSVASIGDAAFRNCSGLSSITIPNSVTSIGYAAFSGCSGLTSVTIPNSVTSIGYGTYENCTNLTSVTIPNSVTNIGDYAFDGCKSLSSIDIPNSVLSIGIYAFRSTSLSSMIIPNSVTSIGNSAFYNCSGLTSLTIGNSVTSIGNSAFYNCSGLTSIEMPNSVINIGESAFCSCTGLKSIEIPNSVISIGNYAFYGCNGVTAITIGNSVTSIGNGAFLMCSGLTSVTIPNNVINIGQSAFGYCSSLSSVIILNSEANIGGAAFVGTALTSPLYTSHVFAFMPTTYSGAFSIPIGIESIAGLAFYGCVGLTALEIPNSVTNIGESAFYSCTSLERITCYANNPPAVDSCLFNPSYPQPYQPVSIPLYVPVNSINAYKVAPKWKYFTSILSIDAKETETNDLIAEPTTNEVEVTWPAVAGAYTYELVIRDKDGNIICTLVFNAQGQLQSIVFAAPSRDGAPQKKQEAGFSFTVTGLTEGTPYDVTITAKDNGGNTLDTKTVSFTTKGDAPTGIDDINAATKSQKIVRDNQVLILRGEKTYTVTGQEVK